MIVTTHNNRLNSHTGHKFARDCTFIMWIVEYICIVKMGSDRKRLQINLVELLAEEWNCVNIEHWPIWWR